jgi:DNA helicase-2/ATP-dependent DNA helicase PcrA
MRLRDLEQLSHISEGYRSRSRFINDLTLDPPTSTADLAQPPFLEEDWLVLSTIHSAKGCEWDVVHIIHAADGMIPSDMAVTDEAGIEEERRLFYVAMTRARDMLYIYFPLRYYHRKSRFSDTHTYAQLTRFITPDVRSLLEEHGNQSAIEEDAPRGPTGTGEIDSHLKRLWRK